jgi:hypothetical protein
MFVITENIMKSPVYEIRDDFHQWNEAYERLISNQVQEINYKYIEYMRKQTLQQHSILKY